MTEYIHIFTYMTLEELLDKREIISQIAMELYGPMYVFNRKFWGSPTEQELNEVQEQLINLGYRMDPTPEEQELADIIYKALLDQEIIRYKDITDDDEDEDDIDPEAYND
jgi:hypothetical protein